MLVTGGAGFIGGNFVHDTRLHHPEYCVVALDSLTYARDSRTPPRSCARMWSARSPCSRRPVRNRRQPLRPGADQPHRPLLHNAAVEEPPLGQWRQFGPYLVGVIEFVDEQQVAVFREIRLLEVLVVTVPQVVGLEPELARAAK
jgi:nucleoside-diphosphate-sugar epimerase